MVLLVQKKHVEKPTTECEYWAPVARVYFVLWHVFDGCFFCRSQTITKQETPNQTKTSIIQRNQYIIHQYNYCCTASTIAFRLKFHIDHPLIVFTRT